MDQAKAVRTPLCSQETSFQAADPSRVQQEKALSAGVAPSGSPAGSTVTAGQGQMQESRDEGLQTAYEPAGQGPASGNVDTKTSAAPALGQAPPPPNYHNPFH
eukprot:TRINITY_DN1004_c0_g1_i1.p1 TRINITY_DN1004_c0_g1~~TRINITY_DN1004_c0_g1_i1.p1  ORF type:complete len:103 (+),score=10.79 TRINITY_DN1004_c0_g1_i1:307-615(+)